MFWSLGARTAEKQPEWRTHIKLLKNPPVGMQMSTSSWRWFQLMDEAMTGRLAGTAAVLRPSASSDDEEDVLVAPPPPMLLLPKAEASFSGLPAVESGIVKDVGTLRGILQIGGSVAAESRTGSPAEAVAAGRDADHLRSIDCEPAVIEGPPAVNKSQTAILFGTLVPEQTASSFGGGTGRDGGATCRLEELHTEWRALEREQAEFDRELIALERDKEALNRDTAALERDRAAVERDRRAVERDRVVLEQDRVVLDRDRVVLDRDRAFLDRDRAFLDRDRVFLERSREDLERERALLRRERAVLQREGPAVDEDPAEVTTEKEVVPKTRFLQRLMAADLDPDQLETRQRLVGLFQRLVEKL
ncbi:uncharacterized protein LOC119196311 isoform X2 [Pungitius pungitius]|uniref:uncharacterized protein LOC119196311 isoform X2 n=1 Tax=Pungitius pungitius TaxID=134920 RepID=UPI001887E6C9|nr:uncharacterized protein LOC119196311 isoform X2 [Pungitius pungitius]